MERTFLSRSETRLPRRRTHVTTKCQKAQSLGVGFDVSFGFTEGGSGRRATKDSQSFRDCTLCVPQSLFALFRQVLLTVRTRNLQILATFVNHILPFRFNTWPIQNKFFFLGKMFSNQTAPGRCIRVFIPKHMFIPQTCTRITVGSA